MAYLPIILFVATPIVILLAIGIRWARRFSPDAERRRDESHD